MAKPLYQKLPCTHLDVIWDNLNRPKPDVLKIASSVRKRPCHTDMQNSGFFQHGNSRTHPWLAAQTAAAISMVTVPDL